jgi:hypothetical protein
MLLDPGETKTLMPYRPGARAFLLPVAVIHGPLTVRKPGADGGAADAELAGPVGVLSPTLLV